MTAISRGQIIESARGWLGTPYHHQASVKGIGCDCLGLVRGVWRELYGYEVTKIPAYSPDWGDATNAESLLAAGRTYLQEIALQDMGPGDVFAIRWRGAKSAKHLGILTGETRFIHAYEKCGVVEVSLSPHWRRMIAAVFRFPDLEA